MKKRLMIAAGIVLLALGAGILFLQLPGDTNAAATTYYVATTGNDSNPCTSSSPCRTIQRGVDMAQAGDTVIVRGGTYVESVTMPRSGTAGNPIVLKASPGETVYWENPVKNLASWTGQLNILGKSYIRVEGFTFWNNVTKLTLQIADYSVNKDSAPRVGIEIVNNHFVNNGTNGESEGSTTVIYLYGLGRGRSYIGQPVNFITGNTFTNNWGYQITPYGTSDTRVADNTATGIRGSREPYAGDLYVGNFIFWVSDRGKAYAERLLIENNHGSNWDTSRTGYVEFAGARCDVEGVKSVVRNNTFHDILPGVGWNNAFTYGVLLEAQCNENTVQNNVIYRVNYSCITVGATTAGTPADSNVIDGNVGYQCEKNGLFLDHAGYNTIRNNIFALNGGQGGAQINVHQDAVNRGGNVFRNNLYFKSASDARIGVWNTTGFSPGAAANLTLSQWNSASGETGSKSADPLFVNPAAGDFHLQANSPAKGAGVGGIDMGAYPGGGGGTPTPTPTPTPTSSSSISASPTSVAPSGTVTVAVSNGPGNPCDWVALYRASAPVEDGSWANVISWKYLDGTSGTSCPASGRTGATLTFSLPAASDTYHFRFFANNSNTLLATSNTVTVSTATPSPTPTPTPIPSTPPPPSPVVCNQYTASSAIPAGFGSPYDVLSSPSTLLISATCDTTSARIDLGKGDPLQYIYNTGYHYHASLGNWTPVTLTSTESLIANAWYPKTANATLTGLDLTNTTHYALGYLCTWTGSAWKCGCRDSACTQSYWQIQSFKR